MISDKVSAVKSENFKFSKVQKSHHYNNYQNDRNYRNDLKLSNFDRKLFESVKHRLNRSNSGSLRIRAMK